MSRITPRTLKGFRDFMPGQALRRAQMIRTVEDTFRAHGYGPIDTPVLEYAEILEGKGGEDSDKELFAFTDKGGRRVAMRFDLTVPFARFVAEHQGALVLPFRRYHIGLVWRGERPQRGRFREFLQCDADIVGASGTAVDAEILVLFARVYEALDVGATVLRINDRRILSGLLEKYGARELTVPVLRALDKREKLGPETALGEMVAAGLPEPSARELLALTVARATDQETLDALGAAVREVPLGLEGVESLAAARRLAHAAGVAEDRLRIDPGIARGLDYYTGIVFEVQLTEMPEIGSVGSGGRYDDLTGLFTSSPLPGVGGSVGLDRLLAALEARDGPPDDRSPAQVLLTHPGQEGLEEVFRFAAQLRRLGNAVEVYPEPRKHAAQMRFADRRGIRYVFTRDEDGTYHGKDLVSGNQLHVDDAAEADRAMDRVVD